MAPILNTALILLLLLAVAGPGLFSLARPKAAWLAAPFYLVLLGALVTYHLGFSVGREPVFLARTVPTNAQSVPDEACVQALQAAEQGGIIVPDARSPEIKVNESVWNQLPPPVQNALEECFQRRRGADTGAADQAE